MKSKEEINYTDKSEKVNELCKQCRFWRDGKCALVEGDIDAEGSCDIWEK